MTSLSDDETGLARESHQRWWVMDLRLRLARRFQSRKTQDVKVILITSPRQEVASSTVNSCHMAKQLTGTCAKRSCCVHFVKCLWICGRTTRGCFGMITAQAHTALIIKVTGWEEHFHAGGTYCSLDQRVQFLPYAAKLWGQFWNWRSKPALLCWNCEVKIKVWTYRLQEDSKSPANGCNTVFTWFTNSTDKPLFAKDE